MTLRTLNYENYGFYSIPCYGVISRIYIINRILTRFQITRILLPEEPLLAETGLMEESAVALLLDAWLWLWVLGFEV